MTLKALGVCVCGHARARHTEYLGCFPPDATCRCSAYQSAASEAAPNEDRESGPLIEWPYLRRAFERRALPADPSMETSGAEMRAQARRALQPVAAIPEQQRTCADCPRVVLAPEKRCGEHALLAAADGGW